MHALVRALRSFCFSFYRVTAYIELRDRKSHVNDGFDSIALEEGGIAACRYVSFTNKITIVSSNLLLPFCRNEVALSNARFRQIVAK